MKKLLVKMNLARRTIARDLTFRLVITITLVFGFAGTVNYFYSVDRDTAALYEKANEIMDNLASVLVTPMWNLNVDELKKIVDVYRQSGIVLDIKVIDDQSETLVRPARDPGATDRLAFLEMTRVIHHDKTPIGKVTVFFSDHDILTKQREIAVYSILVFAFITIALIIATTLLLKRYLNEPFQKLESGLEVISQGNYAHQFESIPQEDMNDITRKVTWMAGEIKKREAALEENRAKLEVLNQAILDIFSCSDTDALVRATLALTYKVCGVEHGFFLGNEAPSAEDEKTAVPRPLICVRGHVFEGTAEEVGRHVGQGDSARVFNFEIKSRYRAVGSVTLSFDEVPDPSVTSLLKSLMSLATLAMIRQSFIRETAFIAAELQVAEAVQRSMLPDEARLPANAVVSYHYEPVLRVGGDWFSVIESRDGDSLYVILGDVTGHGLAQGLVTTAMAGAIQVVEAMLREGGESSGISRPSQILTQLGNVISRIAGKSDLRMTCVAAQLDFKNQKLHICNAGHTFPLVLKHDEAGKVTVEVVARNQQLMLGETNLTATRHVYTDTTYPLNPDDVLVFYTDGLTEAVDKDGKPFTRKFQRYFSKAIARRGVAEIRDELIGLFRAHTGEVPCKDDICVLVVGRKPERALRIAS